MSDYLSRSEIYRVLYESFCDEEQVEECFFENDVDDDGSEIEDNATNIEHLQDDNFLEIDDIFSDSDQDDSPLTEHQKVKYIAKSGKETREYLVHKPRVNRRAPANIFRQTPGLTASGKCNDVIGSFLRFFLKKR